MSSQDIEESINHVMRTHKRKVSQLESLKHELGLYFDEEEATRMAKETMKELNPVAMNAQQITIEQIVSSARKQHTRKVSQFRAIQSDIAQYFPNEEDSTKLAAKVMKDFNPNNLSGKQKEIDIDTIVNNAMTNHRRKVSQFRAIQNDLGIMFDETDVNTIAKDVMKQMFAMKQTPNHKYMDDEALTKRKQRANKTRKESIATPNIFGDNDDDDDDDVIYANKRRGSTECLDNVHLCENLQEEIEDLTHEIEDRNREIERMKQIIEDITESKTSLAINSDRSLNQMREYLLKYQQSLFRI